MSSLPGYDLEDFISWYYRYSFAAGTFESAFSVSLAEAIGTGPIRELRLTDDEFARVVRCFEPARSDIEVKLQTFEEEECSWRDYSYYSSEWAPQQCYLAAEAIICHLNIYRYLGEDTNERGKSPSGIR